MDRVRVGRLGAALLVLGGLLEAGAYAVGTVVSLPGTTLVGGSVLGAHVIGLVCVGLGLILTGIAFRGIERTGLIAAGAISLLVPVVNAAQDATGAPLGPGPSQLAYFLLVLSVVVAALLLLRDPRLPSAVRRSIAVPAVGFLLALLTLFLPLPAVPGTIVLPWVGMAVAGVMLFGSWSRPLPTAARGRDG